MKENEPRCELDRLSFVYLRGGLVQMGTYRPIPCTLEGYRRNETPVRTIEVEPFWICRYKVTNLMFEAFKPHERAETSPSDECPVTEITYGEVLSFIDWLNKDTGKHFRLPTEGEWCFAAAPFGQEYPHGNTPNFDAGHVHGDSLPRGALPVGDPRFPRNCYGLDQMGYNVSEMTQGMYYTEGHNGAETDGAYCIVKGGNWGHCKRGPRLASRAIIDVADRNPRVGFRLAHDAK